MKKLIKLLAKNGLTIASAESITGGLFASELVEVDKASSVYLGSFITYANSIKESVLKISLEDIEKYGVISAEIVKLMAGGTFELIPADVIVSFSGNAGPSKLEGKPVGSIYTCIKIYNRYHIYYDQLKGSRSEIRQEIVEITKDRIIELLTKKGD